MKLSHNNRYIFFHQTRAILPYCSRVLKEPPCEKPFGWGPSISVVLGVLEEGSRGFLEVDDGPHIVDLGFMSGLLYKESPATPVSKA